MRTKSLLVGLCCLFVVMIVLAMSTRSQKAEEPPKFEVIEIGIGEDPQWSPDGTKISFLNNGWVCVTNADGKGEIQKLFEIPKTAFRYYWLDSTEFLFQETEQERDEKGKLQKITNSLASVSLDGMKRTIVASDQDLASPFFFSAPLFMPDGTVGYYQFPPGKSWISDDAVFKVIKQGKLSPDSSLKQLRAVIIPVASYTISGDIWIESLDKSIKKRITTGKLCSFPELSPDGVSILVDCGHECGMCVLDLQGNISWAGEKGTDSADISEGSIGIPQAKWSPDGKKILYMRLTSKILDWDGQAMENIRGVIHIANVDGSGIQVIDIPDVIEINPIWSPDGRKITCTGEKTGKVYVVKLK
jgi:Tol biopolymer transport system component